MNEFVEGILTLINGILEHKWWEIGILIIVVYYGYQGITTAIKHIYQAWFRVKKDMLELKISRIAVADIHSRRDQWFNRRTPQSTTTNTAPNGNIVDVEYREEV